MIDFAVVIPARLDSKRLPRKALELIHHKPIIQWVYERAIASDAKEVLIATDSEEISSVANSFGATAVMTSQKHKSEQIESLKWQLQIIGQMTRLLSIFKVIIH